jgi:hypothetical protein
MNEPPRSIHVWRQSITVAMSRNLYEEGMNPLEPKVDRRYETDGITGSQFLSYEFGLACLYKIFGFHESLHRWWSMLFYLFIAAGMYAFIFELTKNKLASFAGAWLISFSPELFYHGINALPDILALATMIWALVYLLRWNQSKSTGSLLYFFILITISGLTKVQFLGAGVWALILFIQNWKKNNLVTTQKIIWIAGGFISLGTILSWYLYASYLTQKSGLLDVGLVLNIEKNPAKMIKIISQNISSDFPELLIGFGSFALFVFGIYVFIKEKYKPTYLFVFISWLLVIIAYHFLVLAQMGVHQYYMLSYLPLLFTIATFGFIRLHKQFKLIAYVLLLSAPIFACIRIIPARWSKGNEGILNTFYQPQQRAYVSSLFNPNARIISGPDVSGCINFYFTHTKGFSYNFKNELFDTMYDGQLRIENYISRGATQLLITDKEDKLDPRLLPYIDKVIFENEELLIADLKRHN